jgi:hypothetical protein
MEKTTIFCSRIIVLFTLHTLLKAIICCLQLNTQGLFGWYPCGWIISHRCSWIMVYVLFCNTQVNLIVIFMTYTCIVLHSLFCQLANCNLFTQHVIYLYGETPLVNCGPWSILLHILLSTASTYLLQTNIIFHTICLILCFQQTSEIDNLTASWGKVSWLCCVQVPCCCWRRHRTIKGFFWHRCQSQLATTFGSGFFLLLVD